MGIIKEGHGRISNWDGSSGKPIDQAKECAMNREKAEWCAKCSLRIAPYDLRTVYQGVDYHQNCFLKLVREQAEESVEGGLSRQGKDREQSVPVGLPRVFDEL